MIIIKFKNGAANLTYNLEDDAIEMFVDVTDTAQLERGVAYLDADTCRKLANVLTRLADYAVEAQDVVKRSEHLIQMLQDAGVSHPEDYIGDITPIMKNVGIAGGLVDSESGLLQGEALEEYKRQVNEQRAKRGPDDLDTTSEE